MIEGYSPTPETNREIRIKHTEIIQLLAKASEEVYADIPMIQGKLELRHIIFKSMVLDFITELANTNQTIQLEFIKKCGVIP